MSSTSTLAAATLVLWAKSDRGKDSDAWHPLICHLLDVAASCLEIIELEPPKYRQLLSKDIDLPEEEALAVTAALVGLHDIGKANPGFQRKSEPCALRVEGAGFSLLGPAQEIPHGIVSQAILEALLRSELGVARKPARLIADALGAHHGYRSKSKLVGEAKCRQQELDPVWLASQRELFTALWSALSGPRQWPIKAFPAAAFQRLMGLTSVADWIGSSLDFHPFDGDCSAYLVGARQRARTRLQQLGWNSRIPLSSKTDFAELFRYQTNGQFEFSPRPLQQAVVNLTRRLEEPVLLIVEAPMGEGKTEASFYAHVALQNQLGHRGCYVGLPSQATGNAMFERLKDFLSGQGRQEPPDLQLLHGAALLSESYQKLQLHSNTEQHDDRDDSVTAHRYFTHLKRALLSEYGAGTIDQALLAILPVKHQFVRLWGLANRTVILDEVHAYDTYTGELLNQLLAWLRALGASVILMSATLPKHVKAKMLKAFGAEEAQDEVIYPRVTRVHQGQVKSVSFLTRPLVTFALQPAPASVSELAKKAIELVKSGGCLACIMNTVDRAQQLFASIRDLDPQLPLQLFHARFPVEDKQKLEETVLGLYGKGPSSESNPARPARAILVATQVVEQSLDLDFDVMLTDLAPVDLVLQRAGRLHRHSKNDGARAFHESAALYVAGLGSSNILSDWNGTYWDYVYSSHILVRSWLALRAMQKVDLASDLDPLVQRVYDSGYHLPDQDEFQDFLDQAESRDDVEGASDVRDASQSSLGLPTGKSWEDPPQDRLPDDDSFMNYTTRKAEPTVTVVPAYRREHGLYLDEAGLTKISMTQRLDLPAAKQLFSRTLKISRKGLVQTIQSRAPAPWSKTALLRNVHLLELQANKANFGRTELELSSELGLIYRRVQSS
jgi:CRISPR-associated endonuclease/helicase Cas3